MCRSPVGGFLRFASWQLKRASEVVGFFNRSKLDAFASVSPFVMIHVVIENKNTKRNMNTPSHQLCVLSKHLSVNTER